MFAIISGMKETTAQDPDLRKLDAIRERLAKFRAMIKRLKDDAPKVCSLDEFLENNTRSRPKAHP